MSSGEYLPGSEAFNDDRVVQGIGAPLVAAELDIVAQTGPPEAATHDEEQGSGPEYRFILCEHVIDNARKVSTHLTDCDIIAMESINDSGASRQVEEASLTAVISSRMPPEARDSRLYNNPLLRLHEQWEYEILYPLAGTDKKVVLLDVTKEDVEYGFIEVDDEAGKAMRDGFRSLTTPVGELRQLVVREATTLADSFRVRESYVVRQLRELGDKNPGKRIGVVVGAMHTPEYHAIRRAHKAERVFVGVQGLSPRERAHFTYLQQAVRFLNIRSGARLDEVLVDRMVLAVIYHMFSDIGIDSVETDITSRMTPEELRGVLYQIDKIKTAKPRMFKKPNAQFMGGEIAKVLRENTRHFLQQ